MVASGVPQQMDSHIKEIASVALLQRDVLKLIIKNTKIIILFSFSVIMKYLIDLHSISTAVGGLILEVFSLVCSFLDFLDKFWLLDKSRIYCTTNQNFSIPDFRVSTLRPMKLHLA